jgi:hypothetical protein
MISKVGKQFGFLNGLFGVAADSSNTHKGFNTTAISSIHFVGGQLQQRFVEANVGISNRKLCGVHTDCQAAGAGRDVITAKGPLASLIQAPFPGECEGMSRNNYSPSYQLIYGVFEHMVDPFYAILF